MPDPTKYHIELYCGCWNQGKPHAYYWRMKSTRNGKIVADGSEGYSSRSSVKAAITRLNFGLPIRYHRTFLAKNEPTPAADS